MKLGIVGLALIAVGPVAAQQRQAPALAVRDSLIVLPDGRSFNPALAKPRAHGLLGARRQRPLVLVSGFECTGCDAARALFVLPFGQAFNWNSNPPPVAFAFPGTVRDTENKVVARTRLFFGQCGSGTSELVIGFAHVLISPSVWTDSTHVATLRGDSLVISGSSCSKSQQSVALSRVRQGRCTEIAGNDLQVES
jgi:hypothetical protein